MYLFLYSFAIPLLTGVGFRLVLSRFSRSWIFTAVLLTLMLILLLLLIFKYNTSSALWICFNISTMATLGSAMSGALYGLAKRTKLNKDWKAEPENK